MGIQEKQLGQARENSTNAVSIYSPGANTTAVIKSVVLCNTTNSAIIFSLYVDDDGTAYDESTAQHFEQDLPAKTTVGLKVYWPMNNSLGNAAVQSSVANALTATLYGAEIT